jgi:hypothetical protein
VRRSSHRRNDNNLRTNGARHAANITLRGTLGAMLEAARGLPSTSLVK